MREVNSKNFDALKSALLNCLVDMTDLQGLRLAPPNVDDQQIEIAALIALVSLTRGYVRPQGLKFNVGNLTFL